MKRRGFFSRLLGLAAVPFVPAIAKEKKIDMPIQVQNLNCAPGSVCVDCVETGRYEAGGWGPFGAISTGNTVVATSEYYGIGYDPLYPSEMYK